MLCLSGHPIPCICRTKTFGSQTTQIIESGFDWIIVMAAHLMLGMENTQYNTQPGLDNFAFQNTNSIITKAGDSLSQPGPARKT